MRVSELSSSLTTAHSARSPLCVLLSQGSRGTTITCAARSGGSTISRADGGRRNTSEGEREEIDAPMHEDTMIDDDAKFRQSHIIVQYTFIQTSK